MPRLTIEVEGIADHEVARFLRAVAVANMRDLRVTATTNADLINERTRTAIAASR